MDEVTAGSRSTGMADMTTGLNLMHGGMNEMRNGMGAMSTDMMHNCTSGSDAVLGPMQQAMDQMHSGQSMLADALPDNDAQGMTQLQDGLKMMNTALDQAQTVMTCMGHGSTSSGMMH